MVKCMFFFYRENEMMKQKDSINNWINEFRPEQDGIHILDVIFKCIFSAYTINVSWVVFLQMLYIEKTSSILLFLIQMT